jgi:hypothetical protein
MTRPADVHLVPPRDRLNSPTSTMTSRSSHDAMTDTITFDPFIA